VVYYGAFGGVRGTWEEGDEVSEEQESGEEYQAFL
jgi:hypothetical protein